MKKYIIILSALLINSVVFGQAGFESHTLGDSLNSNFPEINPVVSPDGNTMYYSVYNHPHDHLKNIDGCEIWVSEKDINGKWTIGKRLPDNVNM